MELVIKDDFSSGYDKLRYVPPWDIEITSNKDHHEDYACNKVLEVWGTLEKDIFLFVPKHKDKFVIFNNTKGKFHIKACCKNNKKDVVVIESGSKVAIECTGEPDFLLNKISGPELL